MKSHEGIGRATIFIMSDLMFANELKQSLLEILKDDSPAFTDHIVFLAISINFHRSPRCESLLESEQSLTSACA
jgi:hypothetical protein